MRNAGPVAHGRESGVCAASIDRGCEVQRLPTVHVEWPGHLATDQENGWLLFYHHSVRKKPSLLVTHHAVSQTQRTLDRLFTLFRHRQRSPLPALHSPDDWPWESSQPFCDSGLNRRHVARGLVLRREQSTRRGLLEPQPQRGSEWVWNGHRLPRRC